ncbi:MAG: monovalent cation/H(+) antiporter subunit G [Clostridia bacterium]|nr:monovalent cation/H(+) antiporter subunit G [Clostridia bacterium]
MLEWIRFLLTAVCMLSGLAVCCISVYGVFRFEYAVNRMHSAAMLDTMGIALCMGGIAISAPDVFTALKCVLVIVFWWLSSPVSSHMLCRLEITTDEQRDEYMTVHTRTMREEREEAEAELAMMAQMDVEEAIEYALSKDEDIQKEEQA